MVLPHENIMYRICARDASLGNSMEHGSQQHKPSLFSCVLSMALRRLGASSGTGKESVKSKNHDTACFGFAYTSEREMK